MQQCQRSFKEFEARLRAFIASRTSKTNEIDDIVQESFLRLHSICQDRAIDNPLGYLYRIAINIIIDHSRQRSPLASSVDIDGVAESHLAIHPSQEHGRCLADLEHAYHAALAELSPRCAEVFNLRRHCKMTTPDVAARLSITTRMVQKHMVIAMAHLQDRLRPFLSGDRAAEDGNRGGFSVPARCQIASSSQAHA